MKLPIFLPLTGFCLAASIAPLPAREPANNIRDLVRLEAKVEAVSAKVMPATVALISEKLGVSGSGVIVKSDGLILTAAHVVQGSEQMFVLFPDGKQVKAKVLGANYNKDIAMVKISEPGPWPAVETGSSKPLEAGDWVVALGHSAGFDASRKPPVRFGRLISKGPGNFFTTDCTLICGDSGGPLFDLEGRLVGINSSIGESLSNNNHAGVDGFKADWQPLLAGETWGKLSLNPFANPEMPLLGIDMAGVRGTTGVGVASVAPDSPAEKAGIHDGDIIQSLANNAVRNGSELIQILAKCQPNETVKLSVLRNGRPLELAVTLMKYADFLKNQKTKGWAEESEDE